MPNQELDLHALEPVLSRYAPEGRDQLLPVLLECQRLFGYLPEAAMDAVSVALKVPRSEIYGVMQFFTMLYDHPSGRTNIYVCTGPACVMRGSEGVLEDLCRSLGVRPGEVTEDGAFMVEASPCLGLCDHAPAGLMGEAPVQLRPGEKASAWITSPPEAPLGLVDGEPRWLTGRCGEIEALEIQAYQDHDGYLGLRHALNEMTPVDVREEIKASGLVGRGGAAFPTGMKWQFTAATDSDVRYVVANGDESEPGTFKDRVLMEGDPFAVLEGMTIAGYAIGAQKGYLYVRGEYPRAQHLLHRAIEEAREAGFLGEDILGSGFNFDIELRSGAGAYICGEETALFESIEGKRGLPRLKPPYPTTHGLFGKPTVINNIETLCTATWILGNGVDAYRSLGTPESPGTKLFCISGTVTRPGVYEVPFGTKMSHLLEMAGADPSELQAVLVGGAAGAFASPDQFDLPMSFETLNEAGLPLGSGVLMAIGRQDDMRKIFQSLGEFFAHESCGKCLACQLGTQRQLEILSKVTQGKITEGDVQALKDVVFTMTNASFCGLGMTAGTAILSALEKWPELFVNGH